jgi:hypothetical protein
MPYFENPAMLRRHQDEWASYPEDLRAKLHVVLVDDGSPNHPASEVVRAPEGYTLELYRVKENKPWNQNGARNLALDRAPDGPVLMTDIDHLVERDMAPKLFDTQVRPDRYYRPARRLPNGNPYHSHPNTFLMNRALFWEAGGANEDFVGYYGSDVVFRRRIAMFGKEVQLKGVVLTVFNLGGVDIGDVDGAATRQWGRKDSRWYSRNIPAVRAKLQTAHMKRPEKPLRFSWERAL